MSIERVKSYRLTCEGEIRHKDGWTDTCDASTIVQYPDQWALKNDLKNNMVGDNPPYTGWRYGLWDNVLCPRTDHIEDERNG